MNETTLYFLKVCHAGLQKTTAQELREFFGREKRYITFAGD
jgi:hypothetical protein